MGVCASCCHPPSSAPRAFAPFASPRSATASIFHSIPFFLLEFRKHEEEKEQWWEMVVPHDNRVASFKAPPQMVGGLRMAFLAL